MPQTTFNDWSGGEYGDLGPTGAKDNMWTGLNMMVYTDGSVGPRAGTKPISGVNAAMGALWAVRGVGASVPGQADIAMGQAHLIKAFVLNTLTGAIISSVYSVGTVTLTVTTTTQITQVGAASGVIPVYGDAVYQFNSEFLTVTALANSPGAMVAVPYGSRLAVANAPTAANRVYYTNAITTSAIASATFGALNFFDVGFSAWPITHLDETRQRLTIPTQGGDFWGLSGTPGVNDVLRRQPRGDLAPAKWHHATRVGESIWFVPFNEDFPVNYTGAVVDKLKYKYLRYTSGVTSEHFVTSIPSLEAVLFCQVGGTNRGLLRMNDVWSYHTFGSTTRFATPFTVGGVSEDYDAPLVMCDGGGAAAAPVFSTFQPSLNRPAKTSDIWAQPGDNSTTPLTATLSTRYWWAPADKDLQVTEVTIDGFTWDTGSASTNHIDVQVRSLFRFGDVPYADSAVQSFDQAASATTADRQDARFRATNPGAPYAQGFQIILSAIRGFAIRRIRVQYTETARR